MICFRTVGEFLAIIYYSRRSRDGHCLTEVVRDERERFRRPEENFIFERSRFGFSPLFFSFYHGFLDAFRVVFSRRILRAFRSKLAAIAANSRDDFSA